MAQTRFKHDDEEVFQKPGVIGHTFDGDQEPTANIPVDLTFHGARKEFLHNRSTIMRNPGPAKLYELSLSEVAHPLYHSNSRITSTGALAAHSGKCTGRIPRDKRVVEEEVTKDKVWWGPVNFPMSERDFKITRKRAIDFLNTRPQLYVVDGFANWDPDNRIKVRVICSTAYHALFMENMLIRPTAAELKNFGKPDFFIYNSGEFTQGKVIMGDDSNGCIALNLKEMEMVILGTCYAGEMKKGVFSLINYVMPERGLLSMHASANLSLNDDNATVFFGLSGTGKTTLSAEKNRLLIGDDEIVWSDNGISNVEGGCYAKAINLSQKNEPEIWNAIRFGCVLENVGFKDDITHEVDFTNNAITENTRACYPIENVENVKLPCVGSHPKNVIFLTCDAFGVLPPVSKLNEEQAMFHFLSGYTAKVAGTEVGVKEPKETFSACFGEAFLVHHPAKYCELLKKKVLEHGANVWLINTGWVKGGYGKGERISLKATRAIIDAIHSGELANAEYTNLPVFNLAVPKKVTGVDDDLLMPNKCWDDQDAYNSQLRELAKKFLTNYDNYADKCGNELRAGGPTLDNIGSAGSSPGAKRYFYPPLARRRGGNFLETRRWSSTLAPMAAFRPMLSQKLRPERAIRNVGKRFVRSLFGR